MKMKDNQTEEEDRAQDTEKERQQRPSEAHEFWQKRSERESSGLYVPLLSKMEDNGEHGARLLREPRHRGKTEWGLKLHFPLSREGGRGEEREREGEGY